MIAPIRIARLSQQRLLLLAMAMAIASVSPAAEQQSAAEILDAAGVQGGLVVHLGCGDGRLTGALRANESYLVHGIDVDPDNVAKAAEYLRAARLAGPVSVALFDGRRLPYIDNLVNLLVAERLGDVTMDEVLRVLAPGGVAYMKQGTEWGRTVKPRPEQIDEWSHYLHGPNNNAVAHDTIVASPFHIQWVGGPKWARHHNHLSSTSAMVSSGGRLFAIVDEGSNASIKRPPRWTLVARDAFSGVVLWKKALGPWEGHLRGFRSGPTELARRLVAVGDRVYVTPGYGRPLVALDAASGKVVHRYDQTEDTLEILCDAGVLYLVAGTIDPAGYAASRRRGAPSPSPRGKRILAVRADTAETLWTKDDSETAELLPSTLCVAAGSVFFQNPRHVVRLDAATGQVSWTTPRAVRVDRRAWSTPTLVVVDDVVLSADCAAATDPSGDAPTRIEWKVTSGPKKNDASLGELIAFSAVDGRELWRCETRQGYTSPADLFVADGLVWGNAAENRHSTDFAEGRDLHTGQVVRRIETDFVFDSAHHHRCYRNKATDRFVLLGRTGVELIDLAGGESLRHCWVRGACQYGVMPANGLLYTPPHSCACYIQSKLSGFWALAPKRDAAVVEPASRLERGSAFGVSASSFATSSGDDWPTFRHDAARAGATRSAVDDDLKPAWRAELGGRLTAPVIAEDCLLVASIDAHTLHALHAADGRPLWRRQLGGRIDSPPTIHQGLAILGCADGYVYCLRLTDGQLVWRFRAAPTDQRTVSFGQVESVWPVTGSVLVHGGQVYCTAGRSSYLDGGMVLYRLDPASGEVLGQTRFYDRDPISGKQPEDRIDDVELPGALPDVLVCDGSHVFLRDKVLDLDGEEQDTYLPHLYCSAGLLDDTWWHRTFWLWGERDWGRASGWSVIPNFRPSGRILVTDESTVFGYGRKSVRGPGLQDCQLFRADKEVETLDATVKNNNLALTRLQQPAKVTYHWRRDAPLVARAMVLTSNALLAAGPIPAPGQVDPEPPFDADSDAVLMAFDIQTGRDLFRLPLDSGPVFNGMAVAGGRLYVSSLDGAVVCYSGQTP